MNGEDWRDYGIEIDGVWTGNKLTHCPKCAHTRKKKYIKTLSCHYENRIFNCHHCGWSGNLKSDLSNSKGFKRPTLYQVPEKSAIEARGLSDGSISWFKKRGISPETLRKEKIVTKSRFMPSVGKNVKCVVFPYYRNGQLVNAKYRDREKNMAFEAGAELILYRLDSIRGKNVITITEGEIDALTMVECGDDAVCSVPNGARKNDNFDYLECAIETLEQAEHILLVMDKDEIGIKYERLLAERLGTHKCMYVEYPEDCKDINDVLVKYGKEAVSKCIVNAKHYPIKGIHSFSEFSEEINEYYRKGFPRGLSTGWTTLDGYYTLALGSLNVVTGMPSSGKSELLDAMMLNATIMHKWKLAIYSPENLPVSFYFQKLAEKFIKKPMFGKNRMHTDDIKKAQDYLSNHIKIILPEEESLTIEDILNKARVCVHRYKFKGLIIDPYNQIQHTRPSSISETEYISQFLSKVKYFAKVNNIIVFIVAHPTKLKKREDGKYPMPTP